MYKEKPTENELSFLDVWHIILNKAWLIIGITTSVFLLTITYTWFLVTPDYISKGDVMVQVEQDSGSSLNPNFDLVNAFRLIDTVAELMEKEIVLENALNKLEFLGYEKVNIKYLRSGLSVVSSSSSYFINISFVDEDKVLAQNVVDAVIDAVIEETDIEDAFPVLTNKIRRTSFASEATYNSPNKILFAFIGLFIGLIISAGVVAVNEMLASFFKSKEEVESNLDVQVLGVIPMMEYKEKKSAKK